MPALLWSLEEASSYSSGMPSSASWKCAASGLGSTSAADDGDVMASYGVCLGHP